MGKNNISPLDGRYASKLSALATACGEHALIQRRVQTEVEYFLLLSSLNLKNFPKVTAKEAQTLRAIKADVDKIAAIEAKTNHDVKAIEYFLKDSLSNTTLKNRAEWLHFALTSEDVNSVSYALMLREAVERVLLPALKQIQKTLDTAAKKYAAAPVLARTHGQPAVGTTFGKELRVFEARLARQIASLERTEISCKFSGAVGNYNAHYAAFEKINWQRAAQRFVSAFNKGYKTKIILTPVSTQIDPHDTYAELCDNLRRINTILLDFSQDVWRYISDGWLTQKPVEGEVGSSTMPQKVNPIDFENAEGNLGLANAMYEFFSRKLPVSRLQRDLSDSTVLRNISSAFGYSLVAYSALLKGLSKVHLNASYALETLNAHPEVLAEAVQTVLRAENVQNAYEKLKALTRGKKITMQSLTQFIEGLDVNPEVKNKLKRLTPAGYVGAAIAMARNK